MDFILVAIAYAMGLSMVVGATVGWLIVAFLLTQQFVLPRLHDLFASRPRAGQVPLAEG